MDQRVGVTMPLMGGDFKALDVPTPGQDLLIAERLFEQASVAIAREWQARGSATAKRRRWLEKVCYEFISLILEHDFEELIDARIRKFQRGKRGKASSANPFHRGLLAIFAHDKNRLLSDKDRHYLGNRLWYAYRHYVPAEFVIGFLMEVWNSGGAERLRTNAIEPDFREWVIIQRASNEATGSRGKYEPNIEDWVRRTRALLEPMREIEAANLLRQRR